MSADAVSLALEQLARARENVAKAPNRQIRSRELRTALRALSMAWFQSHRRTLAGMTEAAALSQANAAYRAVLDATEKNSTKKTYLDAMAEAKSALVALRAQVIVGSAGVDEAAPDFSSLASDPEMQKILIRRWDECRRCLAAQAPLAAIVMMGGLLEALFVARANRSPDKSALFKAATSPIDPKTRKPLDLRDWTLRPYLDVGHELGWITRSAKDVAAVLRDYRNYVHPEKERSHGVVLGIGDSEMLWGITKSLARQLLGVQTSSA